MWAYTKRLPICAVGFEVSSFFSLFKQMTASIELAQLPSQSSLRQQGKASIPYWEPTDNRRQHTKHRRNGELAPCGLCTLGFD